MHPAQVLDLQADLYTRTMQDSVQRVMRSHYVLDSNPYRKPHEAEEEATHIAAVTPTALQVGSAYYVEPDMTDLVIGASLGLDETDTFRYDELPTECGFAYFEKPLILKNVRGVNLLVNGLLWFSASMYDKQSDQIKHGTILMLLNDHDTTPDDIAKRIMQGERTILDYQIYRVNMGRWGLIGFEMMWNGMEIGPAMTEASKEKHAQMISEGQIPESCTNIRRQIHSFWLMLGQTVTHVREEEAPRPYARRARRMKLPERVTVIRLRRHERKGDGVGETAVEWSHKWWSRGHWAWRHCSEQHPIAEPDGKGGWHVRVYVRGSIKGPADKPLKITSKIYALVE